MSDAYHQKLAEAEAVRKKLGKDWKIEIGHTQNLSNWEWMLIHREEDARVIFADGVYYCTVHTQNRTITATHEKPKQALLKAVDALKDDIACLEDIVYGLIGPE